MQIYLLFRSGCFLLDSPVFRPTLHSKLGALRTNATWYAVRKFDVDMDLELPLICKFHFI